MLSGNNELRFDGRVAIVTGAGNGLGRAHARLLGSRGCKVVVNDIGANVGVGVGDDPGPANAVVREIIDAGGEAVANTESVAGAGAASRIVEAAMDSYGRVDILVNNAGFSPSIPFSEWTEEFFAQILSVNLVGAMALCSAVWKPMTEQRYGRIVNVTSGVIYGQPNFSSYIAAKGGIFGLSRALAVEGAPFNIQCNSLAPHAGTRGTDRFHEEALRARWAKLTPDLVAPAVAFLAHEDCPVTGQCIDTGGGLVSTNFLAQTDGYFEPNMTIENLRDNFDKVMDRSIYRCFNNFPEFSAYFTDRIGI